MVAQLVRAPRHVAFVNADDAGYVALAEPVAEAQAEEQDLFVFQSRKPVSRGLTEGVVPAVLGLLGQRQADLLLRQGLLVELRTHLRQVPVLKDADEPGSERALTVVASQHRERAFGCADDQVAPELGDRGFLLFFITRIKAHRSRPQRVDEQAVGPAGAAGEQALPSPLLPLQAAAAQIPIDRV